MSKSCLGETVYQIIQRHWEAHLVSVFDSRQYCHINVIRNGSVTWEFIHPFSEITCTFFVIRQLKFSWEPAKSVFLPLVWRWGRDILSPSSPTGETRGAGWHKPSSKQVCWSISSLFSFPNTCTMNLIVLFFSWELVRYLKSSWILRSHSLSQLASCTLSPWTASKSWRMATGRAASSPSSLIITARTKWRCTATWTLTEAAGWYKILLNYFFFFLKDSLYDDYFYCAFLSSLLCEQIFIVAVSRWLLAFWQKERHPKACSSLFEKCFEQGSVKPLNLPLLGAPATHNWQAGLPEALEAVRGGFWQHDRGVLAWWALQRFVCFVDFFF